MNKAKKTLLRVKTESINLGVSVYTDFTNLVEYGTSKTNFYKLYKIDFSKYGYLEYVLFAECLNLFENFGYDQLIEIIDEIEDTFSETVT